MVPASVPPAAGSSLPACPVGRRRTRVPGNINQQLITLLILNATVISHPNAATNTNMQSYDTGSSFVKCTTFFGQVLYCYYTLFGIS